MIIDLKNSYLLSLQTNFLIFIVLIISIFLALQFFCPVCYASDILEEQTSSYSSSSEITDPYCTSDEFSEQINNSYAVETTSLESSIEDNDVAQETSRILLEDKIHHYIQSYILENRTIPEPQKKRTVRRILKTGAILIGSTAGGPWAQVSFDAADNPVLGGIYTASTIISYGATSAWMGAELVDHLKPISPEEKYILNPQDSKVYKHVLCNVAGLISTIPTIAKAYTFNDQKWLVAPAALISYFFRTQGFYGITSSIDYLKSQLSHKKTDTLNDQIMHDILSLPDENVEDLKRNVQEIFNKYITCEAEEFEQKKNWLSDYKFQGQDSLKKILVGSVLIFPISMAVVDSTLSYEALKKITDHDYLCMPGAIIAALPMFVLDTIACTSTMADIYDGVCDFMNKKPKIQTFNNTFYPIMTKVSPVLLFTISALSSMSEYYIAHETMNHSPWFNEPLKNILPWMVFVTDTVLDGYGAVHLFNKAVNYASVRWGDPRKKFMAQINNKVSTVGDFIHVYKNKFFKTEINKAATQ